MRRGFGSTIIERSVPYELEGKAEVSYDISGVKALFVIPGKFIDRAQGPGEATDMTDQPPEMKKEHIRSVLVLEDNMIIAMETEACLKEIGIESVRLASNVARAIASIQENAPDFALLDINLGAETSEPVAKLLASTGVPFALTTGYGDNAHLRESYPDAPEIQKPYTIDDLVRILAVDTAQVANGS